MCARLRLFCALLLLAAAAPAWAQNNNIVAALNENQVNITTRFTGKELLIFGALAQPGQVIIKLVSPVQAVTLTHKKHFGIFWLDAGHEKVLNAPGLVHILASAPKDSLLPLPVREQYGLSWRQFLQQIRFSPAPDNPGLWQQALLRLKQHSGYYVEDDQAVTIIDQKLFSARITLPSNLPLGRYQLQILLVSNGRVIDQHFQHIDVRQVSMEQWVSSITRDDPWTFAIFFTLVVGVVGLVLGILLRRMSA